MADHDKPKPPARRLSEIDTQTTPTESIRFDAAALSSGNLEGFRSRPDDANDDSLAPGTSLGPYEIHELLGKGGMGLVYRAFDQRLKRWVALKVLRLQGSEASARMLAEAQAQARVDHQNVCKVYEAGEIDGQPYIAMQWIQGRPLRELFPELSLDDKLDIVRRITEGIHAAHRQGLIHRDLKPSNIMVERGEEGGWRPYVLDFGLAREQAAPGATSTGELKGTPSYMPPEQISGDARELDARADIYSLGATLYEGLAGRPLFHDTGGLGVLVKVMHEEPETLRAVDRSIPTDVETVVMKCLEKNPADRYSTALELAQDLQRLQQREPIAGRGVGVVERWRRRLRKQRVAVLTAALVLIVVAATILLLMSQMRTREHSRELEAAVQDVRFIDTIMTNAYRAPLHDVTPEKAKIRERLASIEERGADRLSGPAQWALGYGHLQLGEYDRARAHLQNAWNAGVQGPEVAFALGRALGGLYQRGLDELSTLDSESERQSRRRVLEAAYKEPALAYLRQSRDGALETPELVEALIAYWEGDYPTALERARAAHGQTPFLYEAIMLEGDIHAAQGDTLAKNGDRESAADAYQAASELLAEAAEIGRSDVRVYASQCALAESIMSLNLYGASTGDLDRAFQFGRTSCERARTIDNEQIPVHVLEAAVYRRMIQAQIYRGSDPTTNLDAAIDATDRILELDPASVRGIEMRGWTLIQAAQWNRQHGLDPRALTDDALASFRRAIALEPNRAKAYNGLGYAYYVRGVHALTTGASPDEDFAHGLDAYGEAIELDPSYVFPRDNQGQLHLARSIYLHWLGEDPSSAIHDAIGAFESCLEVSPSYADAVAGIAEAYVRKAEYVLSVSDDPSPSLELASTPLERGEALPSASDNPWLHIARARYELARARWLVERGQPSGDAFQSAIDSFDKALALNPASGYTHLVLAKGYRYWAESENGRNAARIDRGLSVVETALSIHPRDAEAAATAGVLQTLRAMATGRTSAARNAVERLERGLEINPHLSREYGPWLERARGLGG
ncbi:MAG: protein kinase [Acidobacteriota bacterium]